MAIRNTGESADMKVITLNKSLNRNNSAYLLPYVSYTDR